MSCWASREIVEGNSANTDRHDQSQYTGLFRNERVCRYACLELKELRGRGMTQIRSSPSHKSIIGDVFSRVDVEDAERILRKYDSS
jgi:hypothetical protein